MLQPNSNSYGQVHSNVLIACVAVVGPYWRIFKVETVPANSKKGLNASRSPKMLKT
jgi:hypothetical protein